MESKKCIICNKKYLRPKDYSHKQWEQRKICSRKCSDKFRSKTLKGRKAWNKYLVPIVCGYCNKEFMPKCKTTRYCSVSCAGTNRTPWNKDKEMSEEQKEKLRGPRLHMRGENSVHWKGTTDERRLMMGRYEYRMWRKEVFERDKWSCVECGRIRKRGDRVILNADHIKPWSLYPATRLDVDNGRTLCQECHKKTPTWGINQYVMKEYAK